MGCGTILKSKEVQHHWGKRPRIKNLRSLLHAVQCRTLPTSECVGTTAGLFPFKMTTGKLFT